MNSTRLIRFGALLLATVSAAWAQAVVLPPSSTWSVREKGDNEFTIGASGQVNQDFNDSFGSLDLSFGRWLNPAMEAVLRQKATYTNPAESGVKDRWNGSTLISFDYHFGGKSLWRPYVGANIGGVYGAGVPDTGVAGLEGGLKRYIGPRTFTFLHVNYGWYFSDTSSAADNSNGQFAWTIGIGSNW